MKTLKISWMLVILFLISGTISNAQKNLFLITSSSEDALVLFQDAIRNLENAELDLYQENLKKALEKDPDFFMGHYHLAFFSNDSAVFYEHANLALQKPKNQLRKAERLMQNALKKNEKNPKANLSRFGKRLVKKHPDDILGYYYLAFYQTMANDHQGCLKTYLNALKKTDNQGPIYNMIGYTNMNLNDYQAAKIAFDKYIELVPDHPNPYDSKGDYYMELNAYTQAYNSYMKAYEINPEWSYDKAMKAKEMMEQ
ncbi:MAG: tetratricopeptide repeat protein [Marinilabilia sp.]